MPPALAPSPPAQGPGELITEPCPLGSPACALLLGRGPRGQCCGRPLLTTDSVPWAAECQGFSFPSPLPPGHGTAVGPASWRQRDSATPSLFPERVPDGCTAPCALGQRSPPCGRLPSPCQAPRAAEEPPQQPSCLCGALGTRLSTLRALGWVPRPAFRSSSRSVGGGETDPGRGTWWRMGVKLGGLCQSCCCTDCPGGRHRGSPVRLRSQKVAEALRPESTLCRPSR